jgi:predicted transcriptional regulator
MADPAKIAPAELEILRYVMDHQPVTVRQAADAMAERRGLARTTVQTLMERLRTKGHLKRKSVGGVNQYSLCVPKRALLSRLVGDFVENSLGGSISPFVAYLSERANLSQNQAAELERIIDQLKDRENANGQGEQT